MPTAAQRSPKRSRTSQTRKQSPISVSASDIGARSSGMTSQSKCATKPASGSRKLPRAKTCRVCKSKFQPVRAVQPTCDNFDCKLEYGLLMVAKSKAAKAKKDAQDHKQAKDKAKTARDYLPLAQAAFNKFIRLRDADRPCISCGITYGKWNAGHYRSVGSNPALRFEPLNNHKQCVQCNQSKSGNAVEYRIGLIARIGIEAVEWLEGPHEPKKYTIDDLKQIRTTYTRMAKEMSK